MFMGFSLNPSTVLKALFADCSKVSEATRLLVPVYVKT
jgi:hypothetical protein